MFEDDTDDQDDILEVSSTLLNGNEFENSTDRSLLNYNQQNDNFAGKKTKHENRRYDGINKDEIIQRKIQIDFPVCWLLSEKRFMLIQRNKLALHTTFPVARDVSGSISCNSDTNGATGYVRSKGNLNYKINDTVTIYGGINSVLPSKQNDVIYGITARYGNDYKQETSFELVSSRSLFNFTGMLLSHSMTTAYGRLIAKMNASFETLLTLQSKIKNLWSVSIGIIDSGWIVQSTLNPRFTSLREFELNFSWRQQLGVSFDFNYRNVLADRIRSTSVGLSRLASSGLVGIVRWKDNDVTVRFPIYLHYGSATTTTYLQLYAGSIITMCISSFVQDYCVKRLINEYDTQQQTAQAIATEETIVSREIALKQQELMRNRAQSRMKSESDSDGLVIVQARYYLNDDSDALDVTIPLQFWVVESRLHLPEIPKHNLLGFCSLNCSTDQELNNSKSATNTKFWSSWTLDNDSKDDKASVKSPKLYIKYIYKGKESAVLAQDEDAVDLPQMTAGLA